MMMVLRNQVQQLEHASTVYCLILTGETRLLKRLGWTKRDVQLSSRGAHTVAQQQQNRGQSSDDSYGAVKHANSGCSS
jgi:hypothetical protein